MALVHLQDVVIVHTPVSLKKRDGPAIVYAAAAEKQDTLHDVDDLSCSSTTWREDLFEQFMYRNSVQVMPFLDIAKGVVLDVCAVAEIWSWGSGPLRDPIAWYGRA